MVVCVVGLVADLCSSLAAALVAVGDGELGERLGAKLLGGDLESHAAVAGVAGRGCWWVGADWGGGLVLFSTGLGRGTDFCFPNGFAEVDGCTEQNELLAGTMRPLVITTSAYTHVVFIHIVSCNCRDNPIKLDEMMEGSNKQRAIMPRFVPSLGIAIIYSVYGG